MRAASRTSRWLDSTLEEAADFAELEGSFDTVICLNVLEHITDPLRGLRNVHQALAAGGRLLLYVPQGQRLFSSLDEVLGHRCRYDRASLTEELREAGFEIEFMRDFNRFAAPSWWWNGKVLRRRSFGRIQLKIFDLMVPMLRRLDFSRSLARAGLDGVGPQAAGGRAPIVRQVGRHAMPQRADRARLVWLILLSALSLAGCAPRQRHQAIQTRLIGDEPVERFSVNEVLTSVQIFDWELADPSEQERWVYKTDSAPQKGRPQKGRKGLRLDLSTESGVELRRETDFEAEAIAALTFSIEGLGRGTVMLRWAAPGQPFEKDNRISLGSSASDSGRYRFEVAAHSGWTGTVSRVAVRVASKQRSDGDVGRSHRLRVGDRQRQAHAGAVAPVEGRSRVPRPGRPFCLLPKFREKWQIDVPDEAELTVAFGLTLASSPAAGFRIFATAPRRAGGRAAERGGGPLRSAATG